MLQMIDEEHPTLTVTHIHQDTQADEMEWPLGELIVKANEQEVHTIPELKAVIEQNQGSAVLLECRNGRLGYFQVPETSQVP
ncbi:MAG: hypothetical protein NWP69_12760, partial [Congregibacter sp.]|nr:hypothetical protein [Congregibacter sp.]